MQIYRGMDIGTAKVPAGERAVPYHCIDILDPGEPYSAALFQHDARAAIAAIRTRNHLPVLCGGCLLYTSVMVQPDAIDDAKSTVLAHDIAKQIEDEMQYPGQIHVVVIRESCLLYTSRCV